MSTIDEKEKKRQLRKKKIYGMFLQDEDIGLHTDLLDHYSYWRNIIGSFNKYVIWRPKLYQNHLNWHYFLTKKHQP